MKRYLVFLLTGFLLTALGFSQESEEEDWEADWDAAGNLFTDEEGLTVVGTTETSQQLKVIEKAEIERRNAPDLATLLSEALDMPVTRYGGYGNQTSITMRGFDSKRIAVLVDGVPVNTSMSGDFDLGSIDPNTIERIEVIYGGSDTKYNVNGALGGVINIITVKKQTEGLRLGGSFSNTANLPGKSYNRTGAAERAHGEDLFDTQNLGFSLGWGRAPFSVTANAFLNRAGNHFLYKDYYEVTRRKDHNEVWDIGAGASAVWALPDLSKLILSADVYYGDKSIPTSGTSSIAGAQRDFATRQQLLFDMPRAFRDDLAMEASVSHNGKILDFERDGSLHEEHSLTVINRWSWYFRDYLAFKAGVDYRFSALDSTDIGNRTGHDGGIYLTGEYKPVTAVLIIPSIKVAFNKNGAVPVPKLGLVWYALDSLTVKNNYFRSFKFPNFEDLYWVQEGFYGNPNLKPEDGFGADLTSEYRFKQWVSAESTLHITWTKDSIHWSNEGGEWKPQNVGEAFMFGWDTRLRAEIPVPFGAVTKLIPGVSYQLLLSYLLTGALTVGSDRRIPYMPVHTVGASLEVPWGSGFALISAHYETLRYTETQNITKLPPHLLLNLTVNQDIGKNFTVFGVIRNLLNQFYNSMYDYPMPGLTITLGVKANFTIL